MKTTFQTVNCYDIANFATVRTINKEIIVRCHT